MIVCSVRCNSIVLYVNAGFVQTEGVSDLALDIPSHRHHAPAKEPEPSARLHRRDPPGIPARVRGRSDLKGDAHALEQLEAADETAVREGIAVLLVRLAQRGAEGLIGGAVAAVDRCSSSAIPSQRRRAVVKVEEAALGPVLGRHLHAANVGVNREAGRRRGQDCRIRQRQAARSDGTLDAGRTRREQRPDNRRQRRPRRRSSNGSARQQRKGR